MDLQNDYLSAWAEAVLETLDGFREWYTHFERMQIGWQRDAAFRLLRAGKRLDLPDPEHALLLRCEAMLYAQIGDHSRAVSILIQAVERLEGTPYVEDGIDLLLDLGMMLRLGGNLDGADAAHQQALQLAEETDNTFLGAEALTQQGLNALHREEYDQAILYFQQALAIYEAAGDQTEIARTYNHLGDSYRRLLEFGRARTYLAQALTMLPLDRNTSHLRAQILGNLGAVAFEQGDLTQAESQWRAALALVDEIGALFDKTGLLNNLGNLAFQQGRYQDAVVFYWESLGLAVELGDERGKKEAGSNLVLALDRLGEIDLADTADQGA